MKVEQSPMGMLPQNQNIIQKKQRHNQKIKQINLEKEKFKQSGITGQQRKNNKKLVFQTFDDNQQFESKNKIKQSQNTNLKLKLKFYETISFFLKSEVYFYCYTFFLSLFLINSILQSCRINNQVEIITKYADLILQLIFTINILFKLVNYEEQQISTLILDIITNLSGYLSFSIQNKQLLRYFKAIRTLRIALVIKQSDLLNHQFIKLINSLKSVGKILIPAAMFICFYALVGLYSFRDYQYSKCRDPSNKYLSQNWTVYTDQIFLCGQKSCPYVNDIQLQCLNPIDYDVLPNQNQLNNIVQGNKLMRYNNIFFALFSTFKQMFVTGSSRLMILGKQVTSQYFTLFYYLSFCYLLSYIYLNIFYGLMMSSQQIEPQQQNYVLNLEESKIQNLKSSKSLYKKIKLENKINSKQQLKLKEQVKFQPINTESNQVSILQKQIHLKKSKILTNQKKQFDAQINKKSSKIHNFNQQFSIDEHLQEKNQKSNELNSSRQSEQSSELQIEKAKMKQQNYKDIMKKYYIFHHIIVILCTVNICLDYQGQSHTVRYVTDCIDFTFFCIYLIEMVFRFIMHKKYIPNQAFQQQFKLDLSLFILCFIGMIYELVSSDSLISFVIAADHTSLLLRTMKYLRIVILMISSPYFIEAKIIFRSTFQAVYQVRYFSLLWLIVLIIFSIMGYHMFEGKMKYNKFGNIDLVNGEEYSVSFQGLSNSLIFTVFAFFNQQWDWFLFQQYPGTGFLLVIWQLLSLLIGLQIMSKYFMALLMNQLGQKLDKQQNSNIQIKQDIDEEQLPQKQTIKINKIIPIQTIIQRNLYSENKSQFQDKKINQNNIKLKEQISNSSFHTLINKQQKQNKNKDENNQKNNSSKNRQINMNQHDNLNINNSEIYNPFEKHEKKIKQIGQFILTNLTQNKSQQNCCQKFIQKSSIMLNSKCYQYIKIFFILVNIMCTIIMSPQKDPNSHQMQKFNIIWQFTVVFFGLEIFFSILTFGIFNQKKGYLTKIMNWVYFAIFIIEILNIIPIFAKYHQIQKILCLRIFRIFVFVQIRYLHNKEMRITIVGFWKLLPKIANLLIGTLILYGFFAILLVKIYKSDFYFCDGHSFQNNTINTVNDCLNWGGNWIQRKMNVSNIFKSLLYLFLLATTEGWSTQVIEAASTRGQGLNPIKDHNSIMYYFFSAFFFFGNMIMLNVFLGLSIYNFQKIKDHVTGYYKLTQDDKMWLSIKNNIFRMKPKMRQIIPDYQISGLLYRLIKSRTYIIINVIIFLLFMTIMSFYETNMNEFKQNILDILLHIFVSIFLLDYIITFIAFGLNNKRKKKFILQTLAVLYIVISYILRYSTYIQPKLNRIMYSIIISLLCIRYFALLTEIEFIKKMINSLMTVFPQTTNIWLLIFVILIIYATIGIRLFSYLRISPQLNQFDQNYTSMDKAIFALIKFSILQSPIGQILDAASKSEPNAVCFQISSYEQYAKYGRMGCGNSFHSYMFFLSFHLVYTLILMSTLMAIIFNAYNEVRRQEQSMVNKFQLQQVCNQWANYDPEGTGYISYRDFWMFTGKLIKIYNVHKNSLLSNQTKNSFLKNLNIAIYQDQNSVLSFQFHEVIQSLTRIVVKQKKGKDWDTSRADKQFKSRQNHQGFKIMKKSCYDSSHVLTLISLKSGLKNWKRKVINLQNSQQRGNIFSFARKSLTKNQLSVYTNQYPLYNFKSEQINQKSQKSIHMDNKIIQINKKQKFEIVDDENYQYDSKQKNQILVSQNKEINKITKLQIKQLNQILNKSLDSQKSAKQNRHNSFSVKLYENLYDQTNNEMNIKQISTEPVIFHKQQIYQNQISKPQFKKNKKRNIKKKNIECIIRQKKQQNYFGQLQWYKNGD